MRFKLNDEVCAYVRDRDIWVDGVITMADTNNDGQDVYAVKYKAPPDGLDLVGTHYAEELKLRLTQEDLAPADDIEKNEDGVVEDVEDKPSYSDYLAKQASRLNSLFDGLFCKSDTQEQWVSKVTVEGQYRLRLACKGMSLVDLSQVYGEIMRQNFALTATGLHPELATLYRKLSHELLTAVMMEACYQDLDGKALGRFRNQFDEWFVSMIRE